MCAIIIKMNRIMKKVYWKWIPGYECKYQASNYGDIKSFYFGKEIIMKQKLRKNGYYQICLYKDGKEKTFSSTSINLYDIFRSHY